MKKVFIILGLMLVPVLASAAGELDKYIELLRSDLRTAKVELMTDALHLTDAQSKSFWPIQREYETELAKNQDARIAMVKAYAQYYDSMDDAKATELMNEAFKLQDQRNALLKKYAAKIAKSTSPRVAVRFAQVEAFVQSLIDVQVRGQVPLIP